MSSGGEIGLIIWSIGLLCEAIKELKLSYEEKRNITTADGKIHNVDIVVKDESGKDIGFEKQKDGSLKIISDTRELTKAQIGKQKAFINKIRRKYAYNMITQELKKQGYQIVEEKENVKGTIKLTARKWVS